MCVAQLDRASGYGPEGRGFESFHARNPNAQAGRLCAFSFYTYSKIQRMEYMRKFEFIAPCRFGLESVLKKELTDMGLSITEVIDGRVSFKGDEGDLVRANMCLATAERILLKTT